MTNEEQSLARRLIGVSQHGLEAIQEAIKDKDLKFAKILYARLEVDLLVLRGLIAQDKES